MKNDEIYDGVTDIRDDLVDEAAKAPAKRRPRLWLRAAAAAVLIAAAGMAVQRFWSSGTPENPLMPTAYAVAVADYPEQAPMPKEEDYLSANGEFDDDGYMEAYEPHWQNWQNRWEAGERYDGSADGFLLRSMAQFLSDTKGENKVISPLNLYLALSMLAEVTDGNSRAQILDLLGAADIETLRGQVSALWNSVYQDDGASSTVLANSLWMNENVNFVQETMDTLARDYYASSFRGEMGSAEFNQALQDWLNVQTGGLLKEQVDGVELDPDTILALASTIYFRAKWSNEFWENNTEPDVFYTPSGEVTCDFMHQSGSGTYYWGDQFSAISRSFENSSGSMWLILPDEGVDVEALLADPEVEALLACKDYDQYENSKYLIVNQAIPKFDVVSDLDLIEGLQALGVTDVFDPARSDYTPMTQDVEEIYVSQAKHAARVAIDEEGCVAAAYTLMANSGSGMPPEDEVDFVLNRPFLFVITDQINGLPLFAGIVNHP